MTAPDERALAYSNLVTRIERGDWQSMVREIAQARLRITLLQDAGRGDEIDPLDSLRVEVLAQMPETYRSAVMALMQAIFRKKEILEWHR